MKEKNWSDTQAIDYNRRNSVSYVRLLEELWTPYYQNAVKAHFKQNYEEIYQSRKDIIPNKATISNLLQK